MDSDRVMVLENGVICEFDEPHHLLQRRESAFYSLVQHSGRVPENSYHLSTEWFVPTRQQCCHGRSSHTLWYSHEKYADLVYCVCHQQVENASAAVASCRSRNIIYHCYSVNYKNLLRKRMSPHDKICMLCVGTERCAKEDLTKATHIQSTFVHRYLSAPDSTAMSECPRSRICYL